MSMFTPFLLVPLLFNNKTLGLFQKTMPLYSGKQLFGTSSMPDSLIASRFLTPGGLVVLGGEPKVGKSHLMLSWLMHMTAGMDFAGMKAPKPLKVVYLTSAQYEPLHERVQSINKNSEFDAAGENLCFIPEVKTLDKDTVSELGDSIKRYFANRAVDIIAIDSLRDVFDGKDADSRHYMGSFVKERLNVLRDKINPKAVIVAGYTTKRCSKAESETDPFQCFGAIRSFCTACVKMSEFGGLEFSIGDAGSGEAVVEKPDAKQAEPKRLANNTKA